MEREAIFMGCLEEQPIPDASGLQVNLEIVLSGASAKVKPLDRFQADRKCVGTSDDVIDEHFNSDHDRPHIGL